MTFSDDDFRRLGFKSGLETHQQLLTDRKLFCRCPAGLRREPHQAEIVRHMRPTLSELGEYDGTALMEFKTKKEIVYQLFYDSVCTYEMDDTPPFPINDQALSIAVEIALLLGCSLVDELHISRKQYLDGSIPTGFQRTAIVGINGGILVNGRRIGVRQLAIEEDSCREVSNVGHNIVFRTDRLSLPLVEVVTEPELQTPSEVAEAARSIGDLLRVTGKVRRGAGSVRQDVNVSIEGGTRVEIKGVSRIAYIRRLVEVEALRQKALLEIRDLLRKRAVSQHTLAVEKLDLADWFRRHGGALFKAALLEGQAIGGIRLGGFGGLMNYPTQPGQTFADEMRGRIRVIACIDNDPNLVHTDAPDWWGGEAELEQFRRDFSVRHTDAILVAFGPPRDVETALEEIRLRAIDATRGVPNETRRPSPDGTTTFERILPGPDRMYPDTDLPPRSLDRTVVETTRGRLPRLPWDNQAVLERAGLPRHFARLLRTSTRVGLAERLLGSGVPPSQTGSVLVDHLNRTGRLRLSPETIPDGEIEAMFASHREGRFTADAFRPLMTLMAGGDRFRVAAEKLELNPAGDAEAGAVVAQAVKVYLPECRSSDPAARRRYLMGRIMATLRGRYPGEGVQTLLDRIEGTGSGPER